MCRWTKPRLVDLHKGLFRHQVLVTCCVHVNMTWNPRTVTVNTPSSQTCRESHCSGRDKGHDSLTFLFGKASFRSASVKCDPEGGPCLLGHLGLHSLCRPLGCRLTDLLQQVVHLEAERLDLFVPGGQRLPSWQERKHTALRLLKRQRYGDTAAPVTGDQTYSRSGRCRLSGRWSRSYVPLWSSGKRSSQPVHTCKEFTKQSILLITLLKTSTCECSRCRNC